MLCVLILYISGGTYSLMSTPNDGFFEKIFMAILFILRVFARTLLRENRRWNTFRISFWCLAWDSNPGCSSNKPTHYLLDDEIKFIKFKKKKTYIRTFKGHSHILVSYKNSNWGQLNSTIAIAILSLDSFSSSVCYTISFMSSCLSNILLLWSLFCIVKKFVDEPKQSMFWPLSKVLISFNSLSFRWVLT